MMNELIISFSSIFLAMIVIWRSSDGFQAASDYLGRNLTEGVRGATINAIGSSMPELFTTLFSLMMLGELDNFAFGMGTTSGSAIFNIMIIPAVVILAVTLFGIVKKVEVSKKVILRDGLGLIFCEFLLMYIIYKNKIDCYKNRIAFELEWNNKTEFYDRDLNNFRILHQLDKARLGIKFFARPRCLELSLLLRR